MSRESLRQRLSRRLARSVVTKAAMARNPAPVVTFTFDDIHATAATEGAPRLEARGARGTFYVAGGLAGTVEPERQAATLDQCVTLGRRGHEIACHTYSHHAVATLDHAALAADLARNQACFDGLGTGIRLKNFAFPYNATSLGAKRQTERRFTTCRGGVPGINAGRIDLGFLRAVELCDEMIDATTIGAWVDQAVTQSGWLIFFAHGITNRAEPWRCTPRLLECAIAAAQERGCEILNVDAAASRLGLGASEARPS